MFDQIIGATIKLRLYGVSTLLVSLVVSALDKRPTLARWDGEDWEFRWSRGCLYWDTHRLRPRALVSRNIGDYLAFYTPKTGDTVLEVGAGVGTEVCSLSEMVGPAGRVIAIEADPYALRRLRKQAKALPNRNVTVLGVAVGSRNGTIELHVDEWGAVGNSTATVVGQSKVFVECRRLEDIIDDLGVNIINYMKMNIEGAEFDALLGLASSLDKVQEMCIACHDFTGDPNQATFAQVSQYLVSRQREPLSLPRDSRAPYTDFYIFAQQRLAPGVDKEEVQS